MLLKRIVICLLSLLICIEGNPSVVLTEKELKLIRFISYLTYLQDSSTWNGWETNYNGTQLDLDAIRYPLAHIGYTAAALAHRTPNYRELAVNLLKNTIQRLIKIDVWKYVDFYWSKSASFPDPVVHENIMYSGHLLQVLTLYESISGDLSFDSDGFDFIWNETVRFHYTTTKLADAIYQQIADESSGGVCCEPGWVYTICQNHPHLGLKLYDVVRNYQTNYSQISLKWKEYLLKHALEDIPLYKQNRYFKMLYQRETHVWVPFFASTGNDGWALAWLSPWFDQNQTSQFVCDGWKIMFDNKFWKTPTNDTCFLDSGGYIGVRMQLNSWVATSFYPIVEKQCSIEATQRLNCTFNWFDQQFGREIDTDNDSYAESFYYETKNFYSNWVTTNLLLSFLIGQNKDFLRNIYNSNFHEQFASQPEVLLVDYPFVRVTRAFYQIDQRLLTINLSTQKPMILSTHFQVKFPSEILRLGNITRQGQTQRFTFDKLAQNLIQIQFDFDEQQTEFNISFF